MFFPLLTHTKNGYQDSSKTEIIKKKSSRRKKWDFFGSRHSDFLIFKHGYKKVGESKKNWKSIFKKIADICSPKKLQTFQWHKIRWFNSQKKIGLSKKFLNSFHPTEKKRNSPQIAKKYKYPSAAHTSLKRSPHLLLLLHTVNFILHSFIPV